MSRAPNMTEKYEAALLALTGCNCPKLIPYEDAKRMDVGHVSSLFEVDHDKRRAEGGDNHPSNLTPRLIAAHREKTRKIDVPEIAHNKRASSKHEAHVLRMAEKEAGLSARPASKWRR